MSTHERARRLTVFVGETDQWHHRPLFVEIVHRAHAAGLAGATALRGFEGYGGTNQIHTLSLLSLSEDLPVAVTIIDTPERIERLPAHPRRGHDRRDGHARGRRRHPLLRPDSASPVPLGHGRPPPAGRPHRLDLSGAQPPTTSSTAGPQRSSLLAPTPEMAARSASDPGAVAAICRRVASWKITYAGTPCSFAVAARQARSRSNSAAPGRPARQCQRPPGLRRRTAPRAARPSPLGPRAAAQPCGAPRQHLARSPRSAPACRSRPRPPAAPGPAAAGPRRATPPSPSSVPMPNTVSASWPNWVTLRRLPCRAGCR